MPQVRKRKSYKPYDNLEFNKIALVIGHICILWSRIEDLLDSYIEISVPLPQGHISNAITSNIDIRNKIQTLKALAFEKNISSEWFNELSSILDRIDNEIRPERNKYVHGHWFIPDGKLVRRSRRIRFRKPQAFQLDLTTEESFPTKIADARGLCVILDKTFIDLFDSYHKFFLSDANQMYKPS